MTRGSEPVEVVEYDPAWPERFAEERDRIAARLGPPALAIEHIGSTAVAGLPAKPIIDIMVGVANGYLSERKPWDLAKAGDGLALDTVLYTAAEALRIVALLTAPWLTRAAPALWAALGAPGELAEARLPEALAWGGLPRGARVTRIAALFPRLDADGNPAGGAPGRPATVR